MEGDRGRDGEQPPSVCPGEPPVDVVPEYVAAALALIDQGVAVLLELRHAALTAGELRAVTRELSVRQGMLASAGLRAVAGIDARDDVVPRARPGQASVA